MHTSLTVGTGTDWARAAITHTEFEELEPVLATQELFAFESVDISECLADEFDKSTRFQKRRTTVNEIEQRERDRIPKKTRQSTGKRLSSLGWIPKHTNWNPWPDEYRSVPVDLGTTPVEEVNCHSFV